MCFIVTWLVFGFLVGCAAKWLHPGDDPVGFLPTVGIGVAGSLIGGGVNFVMDWGSDPFQTSGFIMSVIGGIVFCMFWRWWNLSHSPTGPKSFFTGKKLK